MLRLILLLCFFQDGRESPRSGFNVLFQLMARHESQKLPEPLAGKIPQGFLAAAQHHIHPYLMSLLQEFHGLLGPQFQVVPAGFKSDAKRLDFAGAFSLGPVLAFFARLPVFKFAEIHYFHHRRIGGGRDFNHIQLAFFGNAKSVFQGYFADVFAILVNGPNAGSAYLVVDAVTSKDSC